MHSILQYLKNDLKFKRMKFIFHGDCCPLEEMMEIASHFKLVSLLFT